MNAAPTSGGGRDTPFGLLKFVSWGTLVLILLANLFLSIFLANHARQVLLEKQHDFAQLMATTMNNAITKRFWFPVYWRFGTVDTKQPGIFQRLDDVVRTEVKSALIQDVRIYDLSGVVLYGLDPSQIGQRDLGGEPVSQAINEEKSHYEFLYQTSALGAFFSPDIAPKSVVMRVTVPLRIKGVVPVAGPVEGMEPPEGGQVPTQPGSQGLPGSREETAPGQSEGRFAEVEGVIGGLEFTLDITADYQKLITFQRIIIFASLLTSLVSFLLLRMLIHRADRLNAQRLREKEEFERESIQNEKLVSMGRMVAGIAHEIRNPLGIIRSSSELLMSRLKDKDQLTAKILTAIHEEAVRLSKTVGDFLDYARPRALKLEPVLLCQLLGQAVAFLEQKCREQGVEVVCDCPEGLTIQADKDLLYRALYNILVNALEAMAGQARSEDEQVSGQIVIKAGDDARFVLLTVMDTGPGIPANIRDKLLDPFFTTKESGTGLGLAITANILRSHNATIVLGDNPDGGARVDIAFAKP